MDDSTNHREAEDRDAGNGGRAPRERPLSWWQIGASALAAAFGVQSSRNRKRDFTRGKALHFIVAGAVFTVLFVLGLILVVNLVV